MSVILSEAAGRIEGSLNGAGINPRLLFDLHHRKGYNTFVWTNGKNNKRSAAGPCP